MNSVKSYEPLWMGALTGLAALILWYFSSLAIDKTVVPNSVTILPFFTAGFGAFCGSYFAFMLRKHEEKQAQLKQRKAALNACLFTLRRQYKAIEIAKSHYESEILDNWKRAVFMPAGSLADQKDNKIKFDDLGFLSELGEFDQLMNLTDFQYCFEATVQSVEVRAKFHTDTVGPIVQTKLIDNTEYTVEYMREILGDHIFFGAIAYTNYAHEFLIKCTIDNINTHKKMLEIANKIFPNNEFPPSPITKPY